VITDHFHPDETSPDDDYKKNEFLDLNKPLIRQMWESSFSKEFYLQQVHQPRHVSKTARCFGPDYLEVRQIIGLPKELM
jgi:4-hydroxysphinganine ceramide fatty acyl 2-hydroxylase